MSGRPQPGTLAGEILMSVYGSERVPRPHPDGLDEHDVAYVKCHARRWWLVRAESADHARKLIADGVKSVNGSAGIVDLGKNARES